MDKSPRPAKPGPVGGRLIRRLIADLRAEGLQLPIDSHILIAVSGGIDSLALAQLLIQYGHRIVARDRIRLLHVDHGWRGQESRADAQWVAEWGKERGVEVLLRSLDGRLPEAGDSPEAHARSLRKAIFEAEAARLNANVWTAHQADDVAETFLWRLFTGAAETHSGAIAFTSGVELRPLLKFRKHELHGFLEEEGLAWREDPTNHVGTLQRTRMRGELMPAIERLFPRAVEHLGTLAERARRDAPGDPGGMGMDQAWAALFGAAGINDRSGVRLRRAHWQGANRGVDLPKGWRLKSEAKSEGARWVLEKDLDPTAED